MVAQRVILWWMLFVGIICHMLQMININVAIVSMVREPKTKGSLSHLGTAFCRTHGANYTYLSHDSGVITNSSDTFVISQPNDKESYVWNADAEDLRHVDWNEQEQNVILSGYYWLTWASELSGGLLSHKYGSKITFGFTTFVACVLSSAIPLMIRLDWRCIFVIRLLQGTIGSIGLPAGIFTIIGHWAPPHERGKFSSSILGISIGIAIGYSMFGFIDRYLGWEYIFHTTTIIGIIWYLFWYYTIFDTPEKHPRISEKEKLYIKESLANTTTKEKLLIPWREIFTSVPVLVNILCAFGQNWALISFNLYAPMYLKNVHDMSSTSIGLLNGAAFLVRSILQVAGGIITDSMIKKGTSKTSVRKIIVLISAVIPGFLLSGMIFAGCNMVFAIFLICSFIILSAFSSSGTQVALIDMSPNFCDVIQGIALAIGTTSGFIGPAVFNYLSLNFETLDFWGYQFFITGLVNFLPGILFLILGSSELQSWNSPKPSASLPTKEELQNFEVDIQKEPMVIN